MMHELYSIHGGDSAMIEYLDDETTRTGPMIVMDFISLEKEMERLLNYIMIRV